MDSMIGQWWKLSEWRNKERVLGQELRIRVHASEDAEDAMEKDRDGILLFVLSHFDFYNKIPIDWAVYINSRNLSHSSEVFWDEGVNILVSGEGCLLGYRVLMSCPHLAEREGGTLESSLVFKSIAFVFQLDPKFERMVRRLVSEQSHIIPCFVL